MFNTRPNDTAQQDEELHEELVLDGIVTVVDAKHVEQHLDEEKPEGVENEVCLALALLWHPIQATTRNLGRAWSSLHLQTSFCSTRWTLLTMRPSTASSRASRQAAPTHCVVQGIIQTAASQAIHATAEIIETRNSQLDTTRILNIQGFNLERVLDMDPGFLKACACFALIAACAEAWRCTCMYYSCGGAGAQDEGAEHLHDDRVTSVGFEVEGTCSWNRMHVWLDCLLMDRGADLFRSKGILNVNGTDEKCGTFSTTFLQAWEHQNN